MADFDKAFKEVIGVEGGYVDHPADKGGPTNWGITIKTLSSYLGYPVSAQDVKELDLATAKKIYKKRYWDVMGLDAIPSDFLAELIFDQGVNGGPTTAAKRYQSSLNALGAGLKVDGEIGPATIAATKKYPELRIANEFIKATQDNYAIIVVNDKSQLAFIKGWINRSQVLMDKMITKALSLAGVEFNQSTVVVAQPETTAMTTREKVYATALKEVGVKGIPGKKDNPRIEEYHDATTLSANDDETAWCAAFVNWCMKQNGVKGSGLANARSFLKWGTQTTKPRVGDVVVFWRGSVSGWQGHVALYVSETATHVKVLGGNQGNAVTMANFPKSKVLGYRTYAS